MRWSNYKKLKNYTVFSKQEQTGIFTCNFNLNTIITYLYHGIKLADLKSVKKVIYKSKTLSFSGLCHTMKQEMDSKKSASHFLPNKKVSVPWQVN